MRPIHVRGLGFFAPGFPNLASWRDGVPDPAVIAPAATLLSAQLRRRASRLSRFVAETVAAAGAGANLAAVALVTGSAHGEIETAVEMMRSFHEGEGMPSPTRFHNSVHNTAAGHLAIATGNRGFSTAVAAGPETAAAALLEAWLLLEERGGETMLAWFDEPPPPPFEPDASYPPASVALLLSANAGPADLARLSEPRQDGAPAAVAASPFTAHPLAPALALALAIDTRGASTVGLGGGWSVRVEGRVR